MYVKICQIANVWTTCAGTSLKSSNNAEMLVVRNRNHSKKMAQFKINSHFRPVGNRFEGTYRFTYERELKDIDGGNS